MTNIHSNPTPLRQKFIEYLTLNRKAERTVHCYVSFIYSLAKHCRRSPDLLGHEDIRGWLYYLIAERKQAPSTVNLAINAVRSFYGGLLQREIEPLLHQIKRPRRPARAPRLYSMAEVEKLLTVGTEGNLRARAFLSCVYGGGLRLSEATRIQIKDLDGVRHRLLISHPKGGRQRYTLLSDNLLTVCGHHQWAEMLHRFGDPANGVKPRLFIHSRCARLVEGLPALQHDPNRPEDVQKVDTDEDGVGRDDAADCLKYLVATKSRAISERK